MQYIYQWKDYRFQTRISPFLVVMVRVSEPTINFARANDRADSTFIISPSQYIIVENVFRKISVSWNTPYQPFIVLQIFAWNLFLSNFIVAEESIVFPFSVDRVQVSCLRACFGLIFTAVVITMQSWWRLPSERVQASDVHSCIIAYAGIVKNRKRSGRRYFIKR